MINYKIKFNKDSKTDTKKKGVFKMNNKKKLKGIIIVLSVVISVALLYSAFLKEDADAHDWVTTKFKNLKHLTVLESDYNGEHKIKDSKEIFGWDLPMTQNVIRFKYKGRIKVAYELEKPDVNSIKKTITFELGKPKITDNYIFEKEVFDEETTLLNRIESDQIDRDDKILMKDGEESSIQNGLYEKAEKQAKKIIRNEFEINDYKVVFK